jgi:hypothetical protein
VRRPRGQRLSQTRLRQQATRWCQSPRFRVYADRFVGIVASIVTCSLRLAPKTTPSRPHHRFRGKLSHSCDGGAPLHFGYSPRAQPLSQAARRPSRLRTATSLDPLTTGKTTALPYSWRSYSSSAPGFSSGSCSHPCRSNRPMSRRHTMRDQT